MFDWSTISLKALKALPTYTLPPTYQLQRDPGNGCYGDAPGYPSYFTQSIYTQYGNGPRRGPETVIVYNGILYVVEHNNDWRANDNWDTVSERRAARLHRLWNPLPIDHPRTRAWIMSRYIHLARCYQRAGDNDITIVPVPYYKLKSPVVDERFTEQYKVAALAEIAAYNDIVIAEAERIATPDNHMAVRAIREFYPDYEPELDLIENPPMRHTGDWWEREAVRPTPETCQPPTWLGYGKHPSGETWCQHCGWRADEVNVSDETMEG